ncbi:MAG TPA: hypothetical protein VMC84_10155 [Methanocella sp.]|uniref:hypothetical protein n=1 Tax=Methanocella sp. TaxID=2052833 RepID=UPI002CC95B2D|nr:hypothetical protein [Methanocella sp.]HTY91527.1 hypothetical protein [Methanocella sp.]
MLKEALIKLGGATLLLLGIGLFTVGFLLGSKSMQATGFMASIMSIVLLYYAWATENSQPVESETDEMMPAAKQ